MNDNTNIPIPPPKMPPPYWDDCGSIDQCIRALEFLIHMIDALRDEIDEITPLLDTWTEKREELGESFDPDSAEFVKLHANYERFVLAVGSYADTAILMAAITMESLINKFCIYNLHQDIIEPLEKLSPSEKLIVASAILGYPGFRTHSAYEAAKKLRLFADLCGWF